MFTGQVRVLGTDLLPQFISGSVAILVSTSEHTTGMEVFKESHNNVKKKKVKCHLAQDDITASSAAIIYIQRQLLHPSTCKTIYRTLLHRKPGKKWRKYGVVLVRI